MCTAVAGALALVGTSAAHAELSWKAGDWDLSFSGNVNGFATFVDCDNNPTTVAGGLACNGTSQDEQNIESGLLPSALVFSAKTRQMDFDISVTLGFYPGLNDTNPGAGKTGIGSTQIDMRQNFLTFGDKSWGTIKVGRDLGIFASDAILSDMTLLGVGSGAAFLGGNTTLGRIGAGYIYADWIPQITYWSPNFNGFQFAGGIFQGFDYVAFSGHPSTATLTKHDELGFQAKLTYDWGNVGGTSGRLWLGGMTQKVKASASDFAPPGAKVDGRGMDVGAKVALGGFEAVGYYYNAKGLGTTAIGFDGAAYVGGTCTGPGGTPPCTGGTVDERDSDGYYLQATYTFGKPKLGVSYGESRLDLAGNESVATSGTLVKKNKSWVVGMYYGLTKSLNLVAEYINTEAEAHNGVKNKDDAVALGAILFF
ncbi:porin [Pelomicrobium methylotrophicum]|nr:porin [Pelomicrobium methylotrophicum]